MAETDSLPTTNSIDPTWQPSVLLSIVAAALGGVVGFFILYKLHPFFPRPELPEMPQYPSEELRALYRDAELNFHFQNGAFNCATLGGCLGLLFGLFISRSSKRILSALSGIVLGVIAGGLAGAGIGYKVATDINNSTQQTLLLSSLYHFAIWAAIGTLVCAAIAVFNDRKQMGSVLITGLLAGIFASLAYNVISSIMFPTANLSLITPESTTQRVVWVVSGCLSLKADFGRTTVVANQIEIKLGISTAIAGMTTAPAICKTTATGQYYTAGQIVKGRFGSWWTDGQAERVAFNTILPPNSPGCTDDTDGNADSVNVVLPPTSRHAGGVNAGLADGSVRFVSNNIDTGNTNVGQPDSGASNYGSWGALGSKSGGDLSTSE